MTSNVAITGNRDTRIPDAMPGGFAMTGSAACIDDIECMQVGPACVVRDDGVITSA
jgi:hypothetical protein